jgi:hypothetical protein
VWLITIPAAHETSWCKSGSRSHLPPCISPAILPDLAVHFQRFVLWRGMVHHLTKVASIKRLIAHRADHEVVALICRFAAMALPRLS